ncbi:LysR family transcriptional regulator [Actinoallomurus sp. NBC_01490]|uniref:LysR family transcriptional regulator n=1 Tax=Actinoallomurus sp. NBC_01490 TaxID=2903557 RepID=UPI002E363CAB|nr:LysR family transcriptional regulator [Actinoallomurus sp. NBC_01490]
MREIEAFLAVAEELHFGRAAERLRVSTPRVSQSVRALERRVGAPLFERTSRRVRLTSLGEQLLAEMRPAYERMDQALRRARRSASHEFLRVGVATSVPAAVAPRLIAAFERLRPQCAVVRSTHPNTDPARWGENWPVDVFVGWLPSDPALRDGPEFQVGPTVLREERAVLVAAGHPLARRAVVDAELLADYDILYPSDFPARFADLWIPAQTPAGRPLRRMPISASASIEEAIILVSGGEVVHLTMASLRPDDPHVVTVPVSGLPPLECAPVWLTGTETDLIHDFAKAAAQAFASPG